MAQDWHAVALESASEAAVAGEWTAWEPVPMEQEPDGVWRHRTRLLTGFYAYKLIRAGEWLPDPGNPHSDARFGNSLLFAGTDPAHARSAPGASAPTASCSTVVPPDEVPMPPALAAAGLQPRPLLVLLPPAYAAEPDRRFPVLYVADGQGAFRDRGQHGWGLPAVCHEVWTHDLAEEFIVVGLPSCEAGNRTRELCPPHFGASPTPPPLQEWLLETAKPFVDERFRTLPGPEFTGVLGASMGGLFSFVAAASRPDAIGLCGCLSPSFWFLGRDGESDSAYEWVRGMAAPPPGVRLYLDSGDGPADNRFDVRQMASLAAGLGWGALSPPSPEGKAEDWACAACTVLNAARLDVCAVCGAEKAAGAADWACAGCTVLNAARLDICAVCGAEGPGAAQRDPENGREPNLRYWIDRSAERFEGGRTHHGHAWGERLDHALCFLFPRRQLFLPSGFFPFPEEALGAAETVGTARRADGSEGSLFRVTGDVLRRLDAECAGFARVAEPVELVERLGPEPPEWCAIIEPAVGERRVVAACLVPGDQHV